MFNIHQLISSKKRLRKVGILVQTCASCDLGVDFQDGAVETETRTLLLALGSKVHTLLVLVPAVISNGHERLQRGDKLGMFTSHWPTERIACMGATSNPPQQPPSAAPVSHMFIAWLSDIFNKVAVA